MKASPARCEDELRGEAIACIFEKPSTRTRVSFAAATARLGATPIALSPQELQLGRGESIADTARSLSGYVVGDRDPHLRAGDGRRAGALGDGSRRQRALRRAPSVPGAGRPAHDRGGVRRRRRAPARIRRRRRRQRRPLAARGGRARRPRRDDRVSARVHPRPAGLRERAAPRPALGSRPHRRPRPAEAVAGADAVYADVWASMGEEART